MSDRVRLGLIVGVISLFLTACMATFIGLCGPVVPLIAGGVAGYLTVKKEMPASQSEGGKAGAISGAIAGGLSLIGQIIAGIASLVLLPSIYQQLGVSSPIPPGASSNAMYWLSGAGTAFCIGMVGVLLAAGAGFAAGYFGTSNRAPIAPTAPPLQ